LRPLRTTIEWTVGVLCLALLVGFLVTAEHSADAKLARRLKRSGRSTQATITKKTATSSGQGRDLCYVTYQFQARQASAPNAPVATFAREVEVQDRFFDSFTEGQTIAVRYDPNDPSVSTAEALIRRPRNPTWVVWTWWVGTGVAVAMLLWSCFLQLRRSGASLSGAQ
jgi:Protein of unknown function (DUF3592)